MNKKRLGLIFLLMGASAAWQLMAGKRDGGYDLDISTKMIFQK